MYNADDTSSESMVETMNPLPLAATLLLFSTAASSIAAPTHIELLGEVVSVYSSRAFQMSPSVVAKTPVLFSFDFERLELREREGQVPTDSANVAVFDAFPLQIQARPELVDISNGTIQIGSKSLGVEDGKLLVSDNKTNGFCAGFSCNAWSEDSIEMLTTGDASAFGSGLNFSTAGGFISQAGFQGPPSEVLAIGTDIGDSDTWNSFPGGTLYVYLRSTDGNTVSSIGILFSEARVIPEPGAGWGLCFSMIGWLLCRRSNLLQA